MLYIHIMCLWGNVMLVHLILVTDFFHFLYLLEQIQGLGGVEPIMGIIG